LRNWFGTFGRNKLLKILSLLLAVALWFAVSGQERTETTLSLNLELVNLNQSLMVTSEVPPAIQVRVMGPRSLINNLSQSRLSESLDLAGYGTGRHTFYLRPNSFSALRGGPDYPYSTQSHHPDPGRHHDPNPPHQAGSGK